MDFFLNNQSDAIIIHIYSVIKLYMFRGPPRPVGKDLYLFIGKYGRKKVIISYTVLDAVGIP